jgi:hypothetical protein
MTDRIEGWLARSRRLLARADGRVAPLLETNADLRCEAERVLPHLEAVAGRAYGRLPRIGYRAGLEARVAGPWSQYLTLGLGPTRVVRMTSWRSSRPAIPTIVVHELAHRYSFDESVTTLRGLEVSARLAEAGDAMHSVAVLWELARLALGAAMYEAIATGRREPVEEFFRNAADAGPLARSRQTWRQLRERPLGSDWALTVYAALPLAEIERASALGESRSAPIPLPRFRLDSAQALFCACFTRVDALTGRRRESVPLDATLRLWASASS